VKFGVEIGEYCGVVGCRGGSFSACCPSGPPAPRPPGAPTTSRPQGDHSSREGPRVCRLAGGGKRIRTPGPTCGRGSLWANGTERCRRIRQWTPMDSSGTKPSASAAAEERRRVGTNIGRICAAARAVGWDRWFESGFLKGRVQCEPTFTRGRPLPGYRRRFRCEPDAPIDQRGLIGRGGDRWAGPASFGFDGEGPPSAMAITTMIVVWTGRPKPVRRCRPDAKSRLL
jgi:hypothetical protein